MRLLRFIDLTGLGEDVFRGCLKTAPIVQVDLQSTGS
jgi:hypothetical protein